VLCGPAVGLGRLPPTPLLANRVILLARPGTTGALRTPLAGRPACSGNTRPPHPGFPRDDGRRCPLVPALCPKFVGPSDQRLQSGEWLVCAVSLARPGRTQEDGLFRGRPLRLCLHRMWTAGQLSRRCPVTMGGIFGRLARDLMYGLSLYSPNIRRGQQVRSIRLEYAGTGRTDVSYGTFPCSGFGRQGKEAARRGFMLL